MSLVAINWPPTTETAPVEFTPYPTVTIEDALSNPPPTVKAPDAAAVVPTATCEASAVPPLTVKLPRPLFVLPSLTAWMALKSNKPLSNHVLPFMISKVVEARFSLLTCYSHSRHRRD